MRREKTYEKNYTSHTQTVVNKKESTIKGAQAVGRTAKRLGWTTDDIKDQVDISVLEYALKSFNRR